MKKWIVGIALLSAAAFAGKPSVPVVDPVMRIIETHLQRYGQEEHFSAIQVTIKQQEKMRSYPVGMRGFSEKSEPVKTSDLFDIGSISKSFTAGLAVLAERDKKIVLQSSLRDYLSHYPHWGDISLDALLNMSSGLPNYTASPKLNYLMSKNLRQYWNPAELIALVYPKDANPPLKAGYFYSNTGYILMDMILTTRYAKPFGRLLESKIIKPLALENTFYPIPHYSSDVLKRLVDGYSYNIYDNPELLGETVTDNNLSWAGAAGGVVANSEDVARWVEHLFVTKKLFTRKEKKKMQQLISLSSGKPIRRTDKRDKKGFGLGIIQSYDSKMGRYWYYEGETLGYRALYMYVPAKKLIITALFNSATNGENDHAGELVQTLYEHIASQG